MGVALGGRRQEMRSPGFGCSSSWKVRVAESVARAVGVGAAVVLFISAARGVLVTLRRRRRRKDSDAGWVFVIACTGTCATPRLTHADSYCVLLLQQIDPVTLQRLHQCHGQVQRSRLLSSW